MNSIVSKIYELSGPGQLYLREEGILFSDIKGDELVAKTIYSAISPGTETAAYRGATPLRPGNVYPRVVGYCNVAVVINIGQLVSKYKIGDHILTFQSHRSAFKCSENDFIIKLNDKINLKHAAVSYLFHLGYHSLITASAKAGHNIGIVGVGALGYTTCMMSKLIGANTFAFTNQKEIYEKLKCNNISYYEKDEKALTEVNKLTHDTGLDIIINSSNSWNDWLFAMQAVNKCGTIVNMGFPGRDEPLPNFNPLDPRYFYMKNVTIKALTYLNDSDIGPCDFRFSIKRNLLYILDMINQNKLNANEIISSEIEFQDLKEQYENYLRKESHLLTTIINWK